MTTDADLRAAAAALADEHCRLGLRNLEAMLPTASEYTVDYTEGGHRWLHPQRAMLTGMADHLRRSMTARGVV